MLQLASREAQESVVDYSTFFHFLWINERKAGVIGYRRERTISRLRIITKTASYNVHDCTKTFFSH